MDYDCCVEWTEYAGQLLNLGQRIAFTSSERDAP